MTHPDPAIAEIIARNQRAIAEATQAPPPRIIDNPGQYLAWTRNPSSRPRHAPQPPRQRAVTPRPQLTPAPVPASEAARDIRHRRPPGTPELTVITTPPQCGTCETILDPDGTCFTCTNQGAQ